jgi:hypothetical protein
VEQRTGGAGRTTRTSSGEAAIRPAARCARATGEQRRGLWTPQRVTAQVPLAVAATQGELLLAAAARLPSSTADGEGAAEAGEKEDRSGANV